MSTPGEAGSTGALNRVFEYWVKALAAGGFAFSIAYVIMLVDAADSAPIPPLQHSEYDKRLDRLDRKGIEAAYLSRVGLLFQNWMTDTNEASRDRALRGHRNARQIYIEAMGGLDAREPEEGFKLQSDTSTPVVLPGR